MSAFEDYDRTSANYDRTRLALGAEIVLGCLAAGPAPLADAVLLDAGCGTGNYAAAVLPRIGRAAALDFSAGMLRQARAKLGADGRIAFARGDVRALPYADGSFDGVMINQVLHHLPDAAEPGFPSLGAVCRECARVLRPGGVLVLNTCLPHQLAGGFWFLHLHRAMLERIGARLPCPDRLQPHLQAAGLSLENSYVPTGAVFMGEAYFDARGPLDRAWRDGDSSWAVLSEAELAEALKRVCRLEAEGRLGAFMREADARRPEVGQFTFLQIRKPA